MRLRLPNWHTVDYGKSLKLPILGERAIVLLRLVTIPNWLREQGYGFCACGKVYQFGLNWICD